jgi:hypothetical protein
MTGTTLRRAPRRGRAETLLRRGEAVDGGGRPLAGDGGALYLAR